MKILMIHRDDISKSHGWFAAEGTQVQNGDPLISCGDGLKKIAEEGQLFKGLSTPHRSDCKTKIANGELVYDGPRAYRYGGVLRTYGAGETGRYLSRQITGYLIKLKRVPEEDLIAVTFARRNSDGRELILGPRFAKNLEETAEVVRFFMTYMKKDDGGVYDFKIEVTSPSPAAAKA